MKWPVEALSLPINAVDTYFYFFRFVFSPLLNGGGKYVRDVFVEKTVLLWK